MVFSFITELALRSPFYVMEAMAVIGTVRGPRILRGNFDDIRCCGDFNREKALGSLSFVIGRETSPNITHYYFSVFVS